MVFSLFGKKPEKKPEKSPAKKAQARQAPVAPGARTSEPPPSENGGDLDFTNYVPPSLQEASPKATEPPPRPAAPPSQASGAGGPVSLDFASLAAAAQPTPSVAQEARSGLPDRPSAGALPSRAPDSRKSPQQPPDSILCIEVEEGATEIPAAIEEAAVLFANGQTGEAHVRLAKALESEALGAWTLQVWLMLFDVLQHLGKREEFEERSLDFVVKFERSAPVWTDPPPAPKQNPALKTGGAATISLSGVLGAESAGALEQLRKAADRQPKLRLDLARLQGVEPVGCKLLYEALCLFRAGKKEIWLTGEANAIRLLREGAKAGDAATDTHVWLLLLELYQMLGLQNEFEEAAVDYAVTYEVSPPSWEPPPPRPKAAELGLSQPVATRTADDAFHVAGEVAGSSEQLFVDLAAYAAGANPVVLDFGATRRIDFVNAGRLLNSLEKLKAEGKQLVVRGVGQMIVALFAVMGIPKVARIIPRK